MTNSGGRADLDDSHPGEEPLFPDRALPRGVGERSWVRFSDGVAVTAIVVAGLVFVFGGPAETKGLALVAGVVAMVLLDRYPISFQRGRAGRLYTTVIEVGYAFVATWSSARVVVVAVAVASVPLLLDRRLSWWRRQLASSTTVVAGSAGALVLSMAGATPAPPRYVIASAGVMAFTASAMAEIAVRMSREPQQPAARVVGRLMTMVLVGVGGGTLGWALASTMSAGPSGTRAAVLALGVVVLGCAVMSGGAEENDGLRSTVNALSALGAEDDLARLCHRLGEDAPALVRGATAIELVAAPPAGDGAPVPRHDGLWLAVERHPAADALLDSERQRIAMIASLVADSLDRVDRLEEARRAAETDPLTGAFNRRGLTTMLEAVPGPAAVVSLDLDKLKKLNDLGGHDVGDAALVALTTRLRDRLRAGDLLARTGGDEFLVVMPNTDPDHAAKVIDDALTPPPTVEIRGRPHEVTASRGIATLDPSTGRSLDVVLKAADEALYEAKRTR